MSLPSFFGLSDFVLESQIDLSIVCNVVENTGQCDTSGIYPDLGLVLRLFQNKR